MDRTLIFFIIKVYLYIYYMVYCKMNILVILLELNKIEDRVMYCSEFVQNLAHY